MVSLNQQWHVIASSEDLPFRHVYQTRLLGQELAVWRDDAGEVNVWENRCPHRGVRLSLGVNVGDQLKCQYHGWKYESGSGQCSFVPAHPGAKPSTACVRTFQCTEVDGVVFARLVAAGSEHKPNNSAPIDAAVASNLRSHTVPMSATAAAGLLKEAATLLAPVLGSSTDGVQVLATGLIIDLKCAGLLDTLRLFVQPESDGRAVIHARLFSNQPVSLERKSTFIDILGNLFLPARESTSNVAAPPVRLIASDAVPVAATRKATANHQFWCTVTSRRSETPDIDSYWLTPDEPQQFDLEPGMHVSVLTPSRHLRQYSLVNTPEERDVLVIGVKHEVNSRGGSRSMHADVHVGTKILVSLPRNQFILQPPGRTPLLIAGGIGVTPILAMALHLQYVGRPYGFHYLARGEQHIAFPDRIATLASDHPPYLGLDVLGTQRTITELLQSVDSDKHDVYVCGPQQMIELVATVAQQAGFTREQIHFEYFGLTPSTGSVPATTTTGYQVAINSTGQEFTVEPGQTLLKACLDHGITIDYSCEQGVCGACVTPVISGDINHEDVYLSAKEKESGKLIMPCVSGCNSKKLVLNI
ncbi:MULTISPECIES: Rieske 2Fe-2S domain-containing protein [Pseudomonas putida group]|uniref:Rieske 2Fe-2S domain-containing protein n=1 Tax=Pseudomonas putida group TaxID=136845 RepID=UPI0014050825|nr:MULTISPECIES: Rieske 2Fe-2S domain-containing protein [Pseudomonas putida group]MCE0905543.1 Rieske 2Fe-2S domain-containing protein [Pseudomonas alloputida]